MARPLRIEFPGAFYHVRARGNQRQPIFESDKDHFYFLNCLRCAHEKFGSIIHAFCLMANHYHLLIETPGGDLSKIMHLINTMYSIYFNKSKELYGHPFQGRFSATLVQAEEYAREIAPYIHLNPVRAGIVASPECYAWSNYREYTGLMPSRPWSSSSFVLRLFASDLKRARQRYIEYVHWRLTQSPPNPLNACGPTGILGTPDYIQWVKNSFLGQAESSTGREVPQRRALRTRPEISRILAAAETAFGPNNVYTKKAAIFISHRKTDYSLKEISAFFEMSISGISEISRKLKRELAGNTTLSRAIQEIQRALCV